MSGRDDDVPSQDGSQSQSWLPTKPLMPFLIGPFNCAGRNLAMMELRFIVARVVHEFDVSLFNGIEFDTANYFGGVKDHLIAGA